ncbi:S8/S53 family peptidase [Lentzea sp. NPDC005914]|uniref:S8/S53 family peptidase n=1 Tax=Lentzea sp. NPDC005914 TaxID=3154572 RepID=UPI0033D748CD
MADDIRYFGPPPAMSDPHQAEGVPRKRRPDPRPARMPVQRAVGLASVPDEVLLRHNARVLDAKTAPGLPNFPAPLPTIYLATELLMPVSRRESLPNYNAVLKQVGMAIAEPRDEKDRIISNEFFVKAVLTASNPKKPAVVDAWLALQTLRAAVVDPLVEPDPRPAPGEEPVPTLKPQEMEGVGLNHLMIGTAMGGLGGASGVLQGVPGAVNGGPFSGGSTGGDDLGYWRRPVMLEIPRPARMTDAKVIEAGKRRPVIAVLDTGIAPNTWLGTPSDDPSNFVVVDEVLQNDIDVNNPDEAPGGSADDPYTTEPLVGELSTHAGHATFIMGLIQQVAPNATVMSIRVMYNDGIASSGVIAYALGKLRERVEIAQRGTTPEAKARTIDIVSLSLGNYIEGDFGPTELAVLTKAIDDLRKLGVIVVASAGNFASSRRFFPAALAGRTGGQNPDPEPDAPPVISVGALNPNRTKTLFSNDNNKDDTWVTCWGRGAALISTFPEKTNAARGVAFRVEKPITWPEGVPPEDPINFRESLESDDYTSGFAMWSGTSFATPLVVGKLAQSLFDNKESTECEPANTIERAKKAIKDLGGEKT